MSSIVSINGSVWCSGLVGICMSVYVLSSENVNVVIIVGVVVF